MRFRLENSWFPAPLALQAYGLGIPTTYIQGIGNFQSAFRQSSFRLLRAGLLAHHSAS